MLKDHENRGKKGNELGKRNSKQCYLNCMIIMIILIQFQGFFQFIYSTLRKIITDAQTLLGFYDT